MHPTFLRPSPIKKKLFEEQILRGISWQRTAADGGYYPHDQRHPRNVSTARMESNSATPIKRHTRATEMTIPGSPEGATRCVCGETDDDGGTLMVQWYVYGIQYHTLGSARPTYCGDTLCLGYPGDLRHKLT